MELAREHFENLKKEVPKAEFVPNNDGSAIVVIPDVALPEGWNKKATTVRIVIPVGYPMARPDCFWADADLRLAYGGMPANTGFNNVYDLSQYLWFSYHPALWNPNADNLSTYFRIVQRRLLEPR